MLNHSLMKFEQKHRQKSQFVVAFVDFLQTKIISFVVKRFYENKQGNRGKKLFNEIRKRLLFFVHRHKYWFIYVTNEFNSKQWFVTQFNRQMDDFRIRMKWKNLTRKEKKILKPRAYIIKKPSDVVCTKR